MQSATNISEITADELSSVIAFCCGFPGDGRSEAFWQRRLRHWWHDNPAMPEQWIYGAKLTSGDHIVGVSLAIPVKVVANGSEQVAVVRSTWRVLSEFRMHSLALTFFAEALYKGLTNINSTSRPELVPLLHYSGWKQVRGATQSITIPGSLVAVTRKLLGCAPRRRVLPRIVTSCREFATETLLAAADATWRATSQQCHAGPVRDGAYFKWYALDQPTANFTLFALHAERVEETLFALGTDHGDGMLSVVDVWPWAAEPTLLRKLIGLIVCTGRKHGFHSIHVSCFSPSLAAACSRWLLSRVRPTVDHLFVRVPDGCPAIDSGCWPLNSGDEGI